MFKVGNLESHFEGPTTSITSRFSVDSLFWDGMIPCQVSTPKINSDNSFTRQCLKPTLHLQWMTSIHSNDWHCCYSNVHNRIKAKELYFSFSSKRSCINWLRSATTKLSFFNLRVASSFFELKQHHLAHKVGRASNGLNLLRLIFFTLRGQSPLVKPPVERQSRTMLL